MRLDKSFFQRRWIFHPILIGIYSVVALLGYNLGQVRPADALRSLLLTLALGAGLWLICGLLLHNIERAAVLCTILLALFYTYGHVYGYFKERSIFGLMIGRHRFLLPLWGVFAILGIWWATKKLRDLRNANAILNRVSLVLLVLAASPIAINGVQTSLAQAQVPGFSQSVNGLHLPQGKTPPDIYYIILDAYSREDVLQRIFSYDNEPFLKSLEGMGFYVARCSMSNYAQTELSFASALNLNYLDALGDSFVPGSTDRSVLRQLILHNSLRRSLESLGYTVVAFDTGFYFSEWIDAHVFLRASNYQGMNGFEVMLVKSTLGLALKDTALVIPNLLGNALNSPLDQKRTRILFTLDKLGEIPTAIKGPKFVFAHIVAPHTPFVLDANGGPVVLQDPMDTQTYLNGYRDEVTYLNRRVEDLVQRILKDSPVPPVIIIQGDHGHSWASESDRMYILNAYYLPEGGEEALYPEITPINSFRVVLDRYFGGNYPLLEDKSFFSFYQDPYSFQPISNDLASCMSH